MMYNEYIELMGTKYIDKYGITFYEYTEYIEPDYVSSDITKKDYIEQHKKELENGIYELKKKHYIEINELKEKYENELKEKENDLIFYRDEIKNYIELRKKYNKLKELIQEL